MKISKELLEKLFSILYSWTKLDFSLYKDQTIKRRIIRRANLLDCSTIEDYISYILANPEEIETLHNDLLISVTSFFRDSDAFDFLQSKVIANLVESANEKQIRVWIPACATGQEAYSISIAIFEEFERRGIKPNYRIFASDISEEAISSASSGVYFKEEIEGISESRLNNCFYSIDEKRLRVQPNIRSKITFIKHNVLTDPAFPDLDLISCRNLLIYFKPDAQRSVLSAFHFSLNDNAHLFLGNSEGLTGLSKGFEKSSDSFQIYKKINSGKMPFGVRISPPKPISIDRRKSHKSQVNSTNNLDVLYSSFFSHYVPAGIIIDDKYEIIHINGNLTDFFTPSQGRFSPNLSDWITEELNIAIRTSVSKLSKKTTEIHISDIPVNNKIYKGLINISLSQFLVETKKYYFIQVEKKKQQDNKTEINEKFNLQEGVKELVSKLEAEIRGLQRNLYDAIDGKFSGQEKIQTVNEELRASNEELQSSNEELQAISKEYEKKISELTALNNDVTNLLEATNTAIIFVGDNMQIRSFTPSASKLLGLFENDVGRPLTSLNHELIDKDSMNTDFSQVLSKEIVTGREIRMTNGHSYFYQMLPYKDETSKVTGAVVTYIDVTKLREAEIAVFETESKYKAAVEAVNDAIWSYDIVTGIFDFSEQWFKILGYKSSQAANPDLKTYLDNVFSEDKEKVWYAFDKLINRGGSFDIEFRVKCNSGKYKWVRSRGKSEQFGKTDSKKLIIGTNSDISTEKELEIERAQTQQILSLLCDGVGLGFWHLESQTGNLKLDSTSQKIMNIYNQPAKWSHFQEICNPEDKPDLSKEMVRLATEDNACIKLEIRIKVLDKWRWIKVTGIRINKYSEKGNFELVGFLEDIDNRKKIEQDAINNKELFQNALQIGKLIPWSLESNGKFVEGSPGVGIFKEIGDKNPIEVEKVIDRVSEKDKAILRDAISSVSVSDSNIENPALYFHRAKVDSIAKGKVYIDIWAKKLFDSVTKKNKIIGVFKDVTQEVRSEEQLEEQLAQIKLQQELFTSVLENIPLAVVAKEARGDFKYYFCNKAAEKLYGKKRSEIIGHNAFEIYPKKDAENYFKQDKNIIKTKKFIDFGDIKFNNGKKIKDVRTIKIPAIDTEGSVESIFVFMEDISEKKSLSAQLRQSQKMDAVGRLAGGIAHDFNNMMQAVIGYGSIIDDSFDDSDENKDNIQNVLSAAEQASELVKQLMAFSRKGELFKQKLDMKQLITSVVRMLDRLIGDHIKISTKLCSNEAFVTADANQLKQALINICLNSRDAMPNGGTINIQVETQFIDEKNCSIHPSAKEGNYIVTTISDNGSGIPGDIQELIFEPFFTTKQLGKGTGLGLASVYAIVERHSGFILVESTNEGEQTGSSFKVYLPQSEEQDSNSTPLTNFDKSNTKGTETILFAEDEKVIRNFTKKMLEKSGYTVFAAENGLEALEIFKKNPDKIDLLVFDVMMPEMNGKIAADKINEIRSVPIIYCSGYGSDILKSEYMVEIQGRLILKPYKARELLVEIRDLLDNSD